MDGQVFKPEDSRVVARYQAELTRVNDEKLRYAALADALADQVTMLQGQLRTAKAEAAASEALPGAPVVPDVTAEQ